MKIVLEDGPAAGREIDVPTMHLVYQTLVPNDELTLISPRQLVAEYWRTSRARLYEDQTWRWIYEFRSVSDV